MYNVKLLYCGPKGEAKEANYPCGYYEKTLITQAMVDEDKKRPADDRLGFSYPCWKLELVPDEIGKPSRFIELPRDGHDIYVTPHGGGRTVDAIHWPPKAK